MDFSEISSTEIFSMEDISVEDISAEDISFEMSSADVRIYLLTEPTFGVIDVFQHQKFVL